MKFYLFDTWSDAYDICREYDRPLVVFIEGESLGSRIFPSGHAVPVRPPRPRDTKVDYRESAEARP